jgi:hypothetical protein
VVVSVLIGIGFLLFAILCLRVGNKSIYNNAEVQNEINEIMDGYTNRDWNEFIDTVPDVRGAADRGIEAINRKRDDILERVRSGGID